MKRLRVLLAITALVGVGCPSSSQVDTVPTLPGEGDEHTADPRAVDEGEQDQTERDPWAGRDDLIEPPDPAPPRALELPPIERFELRNGLEVVVVRNEALPVVSFQLAIETGSIDAPRDQSGIAQLTAALLPRGTRKRSAVEVARAVEDVGAVLSANAGRESTVASCRSLSLHRDLCLDVLSDVVLRPTFPKDEVEKSKKKLHNAVARRNSNPGQLAAAHFSDLLWGRGHIRAWMMSHSTVDAIGRDDIRTWYRTWYKPNNAVLAVAGNIQLEGRALRRAIGRRFGGWRRGKVPEHPEASDPRPGQVRVRVIDIPRQSEAYIRLGHTGPAHADERFYDALVLNHVLGGGSDSRLMRALPPVGDQRIPAASELDRERLPGELALTAVTPVNRAVATVDAMLREMKRLSDEGPTDAEILAAVTDVGGGYASRFESPIDLASALLSAQLHGLDDSYVGELPQRLSKVTRESAAAAAEEILRPSRAVVVIAGDAGKIEPELRAAGLAFETIDYRLPVASWERDGGAGDAPDDPEAEDRGRKIIARALAAKGGAEKLAAIETLDGTTEATVVERGQEQQLVFRRRYRRPDQLRHDISNGSKMFTITITGDGGWARHPDKGVADLPPQNIAEAKKQLWRDHEFILLRARKEGVKVHHLGRETADGVEFHVVRVTSKDRALSAKLYIDQDTWMLGRMTYVEQGVPVTEVYEDYRKVDGIQVAHVRKTLTKGSSMEAELTEMELNPTLEPSLFEKPVQ